MLFSKLNQQDKQSLPELNVTKPYHTNSYASASHLRRAAER